MIRNTIIKCVKGEVNMMKCDIHGTLNDLKPCKNFYCDDVHQVCACLEGVDIDNLEGDEIEDLKHCSDCKYRNCANCSHFDVYE